MIQKNLNLIKNFFITLFSNRVYLTIYIILILLILIISLHNQEKQELEHFNNLKFNNKLVQYSDCKKKCVGKYENPDQVKACKKYCKCKKECVSKGNSKKCLKGCKELKTNIYRDDEQKMEKIKLKQEIKLEEKKEKKENKIKEIKEKKEQDKQDKQDKQLVPDNKVKNYMMNLINQYSSENEKMFLLDMSSSSGRFYKDFKNVFRFK